MFLGKTVPCSFIHCMNWVTLFSLVSGCCCDEVKEGDCVATTGLCWPFARTASGARLKIKKSKTATTGTETNSTARFKDLPLELCESKNLLLLVLAMWFVFHWKKKLAKTILVYQHKLGFLTTWTSVNKMLLVNVSTTFWCCFGVVLWVWSQYIHSKGEREH